MWNPHIDINPFQTFWNQDILQINIPDLLKSENAMPLPVYVYSMFQIMSIIAQSNSTMVSYHLQHLWYVSK